jgi:hypothetical protein
MTTVQSLMLSVCFGAVIGTFIGNIVVLIKMKVDEHKSKKNNTSK